MKLIEENTEKCFKNSSKKSSCSRINCNDNGRRNNQDCNERLAIHLEPFEAKRWRHQAAFVSIFPRKSRIKPSIISLCVIIL